MPLNPALTRALTRELNISKIRAGAGGGANAQALVMTTVGGGGPPSLSNGGRTLTTAGSNFSWGWGTGFDRDFTEGGKFMIEVTVDTIVSSTFMGLGFYDPAQTVSSNYTGNHDGCGCLFQTSTSLTRVYDGPLDSDFTAASPKLAVVDDDVVTMAVNFDDDKVTFYVNGADGTGEHSLTRSSPTSNNLRPVLKGYQTCVMSINPVILFPVDGYIPWG